MTEKNITIHVDGYDAAQVEEWLTEKVAASVRERMDAKVKDAIAASVRDLVDELTRERLHKEINALLDEGWKGTDSYGNENGKKYTLRDRVRGVFEAKADSYSNSGSRVERWVKEAVDYQLKRALEEELASARARLRAAFDEVLQAKFTSTIRDALGLKS